MNREYSDIRKNIKRSIKNIVHIVHRNAMLNINEEKNIFGKIIASIVDGLFEGLRENTNLEIVQYALNRLKSDIEDELDGIELEYK